MSTKRVRKDRRAWPWPKFDESAVFPRTDGPRPPQNAPAVVTKMIRRLRAAVLRQPFLNPFCDCSDPRLSQGEADVLRRMLLGSGLSESRTFSEDIGCYPHHWTWGEYPEYPTAYGIVVRLLMDRRVLRGVRCAGGYTWIIFTPEAERVMLGRLGPAANTGDAP